MEATEDGTVLEQKLIRKYYTHKLYSSTWNGKGHYDDVTVTKDFDDTPAGRQELALEHGAEKDEEYERIVSVYTDISDKIEAIVKAGLRRNVRQDRDRQERIDRREFQRLKEKLGE